MLLPIPFLIPCLIILRFGQAAPVTISFEKRGPVLCLPIHNSQRLVFRHCIAAVNQIARMSSDLNALYSFGPANGPAANVDVPIFTHDPMSWVYGMMENEGSRAQLSDI